MNTLLMNQLEILPRPLYEWARSINIHLRDRGYVAHSAMRAAFGSAAPQPFVLLGDRNQPRINVLGYSSATEVDSGSMRDKLALAEPVLAEAFPLDRLRQKQMPSRFPLGTVFGFRVECCPITRLTVMGNNGKKKVREKDAFLAACDAHPEGGVKRETVYSAWIGAELNRGGAAELLECRMKAFQIFTPVRRPGKGKRPVICRGGGGKKCKYPWAVMDGLLRVHNEEAFLALLARGLGRHRAFGLGLLLLRPV